MAGPAGGGSPKAQAGRAAVLSPRRLFRGSDRSQLSHLVISVARSQEGPELICIPPLQAPAASGLPPPKRRGNVGTAGGRGSPSACGWLTRAGAGRFKPPESAADALGWGEEPIAPARTVKSDPIVGRPDPEEQARTDTDACTEDFTRLRDSESGSPKETLPKRAGGLASAQCPACGETRCESAGSLTSVAFSPASGGGVEPIPAHLTERCGFLSGVTRLISRDRLLPSPFRQHRPNVRRYQDLRGTWLSRAMAMIVQKPGPRRWPLRQAKTPAVAGEKAVAPALLIAGRSTEFKRPRQPARASA